MLWDMSKVYAIFSSFLENHNSIVTKLQVQMQPRMLYRNIMHTPHINMCWGLSAINVRMECITSSKIRTIEQEEN